MSLEAEVGSMLARRGETVAVAESLTGGLVASRVTDVPGASAYLLEAVVAYSNAAKVRLLGVREAAIEAHGAVSEQVAREMAEGVRERAGATWGLSTTGIAGPTGATATKPVGLVFVAVAGPGGTVAERHLLGGDRATVKASAAEAALRLLLERLRAA